MASAGQTDSREQEHRYREAAREHGAMWARLARGYEFDAEKRRDLEQEIHIAIWRSMAVFDSRCSVRTWVYRVAHNTAVSYAMRHKRTAGTVSLEDLDVADDGQGPAAADRQLAMERLMALVRKLKPLDRQTVLLYLEGMEAAEIGEITGDSAGSVAVRIHRLKQVLARQFAEGGRR
ncbi:MAG: sigma-70 family RNA polymerase sigma factor [Bryobacterales bacterium]|nr:sigma-70 family RNA polymerase sigma factor [Bryobacterales bacterium]